jgi:predicted RNase H-like nuclease (RuvC/YqgF family)
LIPPITAQPSALVEDAKETKQFLLIPTSVMDKRCVQRPVTDECVSLKEQLDQLRNELAMKRNKNQQLEKERQKTDRLKKEIDAYQTRNYRLKQEQYDSMALLLLYEERIGAIETKLSEMEIRRLTKEDKGMIVDDTHCRKCRKRRIEYALEPRFHFGKISLNICYKVCPSICVYISVL